MKKCELNLTTLLTFCNPPSVKDRRNLQKAKNVYSILASDEGFSFMLHSNTLFAVVWNFLMVL
jgi:hypothetical protein